MNSLNIGDELARIHREVEQAMGNMCLAMARGRGSRAAVDTWAAALERGARDLRALEARLQEGKR